MVVVDVEAVPIAAKPAWVTGIKEKFNHEMKWGELGKIFSSFQRKSDVRVASQLVRALYIHLGWWPDVWVGQFQVFFFREWITKFGRWRRIFWVEFEEIV